MDLEQVSNAITAPAVAGTSRPAGARAYARLHRAVADAGLLERTYGFYLRRGIAGYLVLALGLAMPFLWPGLAGATLGGVIIGFGLIQVALIGHDAGHLAVFRGTKANWALGILCWSITAGVSFWSWRDRHNRHHGATNELDEDPDIFDAGLIAWTPEIAAGRRGWRRWVTRYQVFVFPCLVPWIGFVLRILGWHVVLAKMRGGWRWLDLALITFNIGLWAAAVTFWGPTWLWVFLVSQLTAGVYQGLVIAPNHKGMPLWTRGVEISFLERQVLSSRNIAPHPFADYFFGGLNYQIEHHLFPNMPRPHLAAAR